MFLQETSTVDIGQLSRVRARRIIAAGRLALAAFLLAAIWLDPSQPAQLPHLTYGLLLLYLALAAGLFRISRQNAPTPLRLSPAAQTLDLPIHVLEMGLFTFLLYTTHGATSPFFPLFTFSIVSASFRWGWKVALWTSVSTLALLMTSAALELAATQRPSFEIDRFLVRCAHFAVIGSLLTYFSFHQEKAEREVLQLSSWNPEPPDLSRLPEYLSRCASHAAGVFERSRIVLVVQDRDEPWANCTYYTEGAVRHERLQPPDLDVVMEQAGELCLLGWCSTPEVFALSPSGRVKSMGAPEHFRGLCDLFHAGQLLSVPIASDLFHGCLLILDGPDLLVEDLTVANLVGQQIQGGLDRMEVIEALQRAAAGEERLRMARDLHDGVLQTLSATAMHLEAIRRSSTDDPERLAAIQDWLLKEQRDLRRLIGRPHAYAPAEPEEPNAEARSGLSDFLADLGTQWGITAQLHGNSPGLQLDATSDFQIRQIIREAAANAVRHGHASELAVILARRNDQIGLELVDNGSGLAQNGTWGLGECLERGLGPRNLLERVLALGGNARLTSSTDGLRIDISLPLKPDH